LAARHYSGRTTEPHSCGRAARGKLDAQQSSGGDDFDPVPAPQRNGIQSLQGVAVRAADLKLDRAALSGSCAAGDVCLEHEFVTHRKGGHHLQIVINE